MNWILANTNRMRCMDIRKIDLNLLVLFDVMIEQRSVTLASEALGLSQPATSAALSRLRAVFGDPLFVKTGAYMEPTPRAQQLAGPIRGVISTIRNEILQASNFDPASTEQTFNLIMPDIAEVILMPKLLAALRTLAPHAKLKVTSMPRLAAAEALENGSADLALGYFPDLKRSGFFQQRLFKHRYVAIARRDHPQFAEGISEQDYFSAVHAVVSPQGREHGVDLFLNAQHQKRHIGIELSHFMSLFAIIANTDYVATVPSDLAHLFESHTAIRALELPIAIPEVEIHQFWHQRVHKDEANTWLRGLSHKTLSD